MHRFTHSTNQTMKNTTGYQYTATDGSKFPTKADKEAYVDQQMEKRALQQEEQYRDNIDHEIPTWAWIEDHEC